MFQSFSILSTSAPSLKMTSTGFVSGQTWTTLYENFLTFWPTKKASPLSSTLLYS